MHHEGSRTIDEKLSDITEMLARIEERLIGQQDRVETLERKVETVTRQVTLAHGGVLLLTVLATIVAIFKSILPNR